MDGCGGVAQVGGKYFKYCALLINIFGFVKYFPRFVWYFGNKNKQLGPFIFFTNHDTIETYLGTTPNIYKKYLPELICPFVSGGKLLDKKLPRNIHGCRVCNPFLSGFVWRSKYTKQIWAVNVALFCSRAEIGIPSPKSQMKLCFRSFFYS